MPKNEFTSMVMIQDSETGKVLVQDRIQDHKGYSFPGGHVDDGESFYDCAVREIKEETGLTICNLKYCGVVHWSNRKTFDRYLVFLYKTSDYSGELLPKSDEGENLWMEIETLRQQNGEIAINDYLPLFLEDKYCEAFGSWNDDEPWEIIYK